MNHKSMTAHTPGPWKLVEWTQGNWWIVAVTGKDGSYTPIYEVKDRSGLTDTARIVACVNYCDGAPLEGLWGGRENGGLMALTAERDSLAARNAELEAALRASLDGWDELTRLAKQHGDSKFIGYVVLADRARAALAKLDGGK